MDRAARRRAEREMNKKSRKLGAPPKLAPTGDSGVAVDVVDGGVVLTIYQFNTVFSVKWGKVDAAKVSQMIADAAAGTEKVEDVTLASGIIVSQEIP